MRFYDEKNELGLSQVSDEQRKRSLFLPLSFGWRCISPPDVFSSLDRSNGYALRSEKTQDIKFNHGANHLPLFGLMSSPQNNVYGWESC